MTGTTHKQHTCSVVHRANRVPYGIIYAPVATAIRCSITDTRTYEIVGVSLLLLLLLLSLYRYNNNNNNFQL